MFCFPPVTKCKMQEAKGKQILGHYQQKKIMCLYIYLCVHVYIFTYWFLYFLYPFKQWLSISLPTNIRSLNSIADALFFHVSCHSFASVGWQRLLYIHYQQHSTLHFWIDKQLYWPSAYYGSTAALTDGRTEGQLKWIGKNISS